MEELHRLNSKLLQEQRSMLTDRTRALSVTSLKCDEGKLASQLQTLYTQLCFIAKMPDTPSDYARWSEDATIDWVRTQFVPSIVQAVEDARK